MRKLTLDEIESVECPTCLSRIECEDLRFTYYGTHPLIVRAKRPHKERIAKAREKYQQQRARG